MKKGDHPIDKCSSPGCTQDVDDDIDEYGELCPQHYAEHQRLKAEDGAPYCQYCGQQKNCDCGPIAENN